MDRRREQDGTGGDTRSLDPEPERDGGADRGDTRDLSRRDFLEGTGAALVAASATPALASADSRMGPGGADAAAAVQEVPPVPTTPITLTVNGTTHRVDAEDRWTLNELLRDHLGLTGSKIGCNRGECGACSVLLDGEPVYSCSTLAVWADGRDVITVEGLESADGDVSVLQQAFMEHNAPQCGFCTPGQLISATALLDRNPRPSTQEVKEALVGNLCRCSNYNAIVEAVIAAAETRRARGAR